MADESGEIAEELGRPVPTAGARARCRRCRRGRRGLACSAPRRAQARPAPDAPAGVPGRAGGHDARRRRCCTARRARTATARSSTAPVNRSRCATELAGGLTRGTGRRRPVAAFAQFTDMHIIDAQSPARVEFLDRLNDPDSPIAGLVPFQSAYRAQEMLTLHVAEAMVQAVNALAGGPVERARARLHDQHRRQRRQHAVQRGALADRRDGRAARRSVPTPATTRSGRASAATTTSTPRTGTRTARRPLGSPDRPHTLWGFPDVPGLLDRCRRRSAPPA